MQKIFILRALLKNRVRFCMYRKPGEKDFSFAMQEDFFSEQKKGRFTISPFVSSHRSTKVQMNIVDIDTITPEVIELLPIQISKTTPQFPAAISKEAYLKQLSGIKNEINKGKVKKVVISRVIVDEKPEGFDIFNCFLELTERYRDTFTYLFYDPQCGFWMGATPELLLRKKGRLIETCALAGTQKRKSDGNYRWRSKEIEEHSMVEQHVEQVFVQHGFVMQWKEGPDTIEAGKVAHLKTDYRFAEKENTDLENLIYDLQPTPAVGGLPMGEALEYIDKYEQYDRGYYTGYIGEMRDNGDAELYVNLRCMQVCNDKIAIYAGGGITAESDPEAEWQEIVLKSKTLLNIIYPAKEIV